MQRIGRIVTKRNVVPSREVTDVNGSETCATIERTFTNVCNTVGYSYVSKAGTTRKCFTSNICNTIGDGYMCKTCAILEYTVFNACNTIWDYYAGKAGTTFERTFTNICNTVRNSYTCKTCASIECAFANHITFAFIISRQSQFRSITKIASKRIHTIDFTPSKITVNTTIGQIYNFIGITSYLAIFT